MRWPLRALTLTGLVALVLFAAVSAFSPAPPDAASACSQSCATGAGAPVARTGTAPAPTCVRDAGCGAGGALTLLGTPLLIGVVAMTITFVATVRRRFRTGRAPAFAGTLLASRLFHPPQFVLGS